MGQRIRLTAFALLLAIPTIGMCQSAVTWEDAFSLKPARAPRPKPSEPDATRDNSGPFRLANEFDQPAPADLPPAPPPAARRWHADPTRPGFQWYGRDAGPVEYWWPRLPP